MLYVTTRNNRDAYTAYRAIHENRGSDGGMYLPFHAPFFSQSEIDALAKKPFNQCVADVLNLLFNTKLTCWDIDFAIGREPVRIKSLKHRIYVGESWHNTDWNYVRMVKDLTALFSDRIDAYENNWVQIAVRIAVLFGIFSLLKRSGIDSADISVISGDFAAPMSAWYARQWGLPVGNIICCCNENNAPWDLICHGQIRTDAISLSTEIPEADVAVPENLERLIYACGGIPEVEAYLQISRRGGVYCPKDATLAGFRNGLYVSVISSERIENTIPSVYRTHGYLITPSAALAYSGLLDYRAKTGQTRHAIVLTEKGPVNDAEKVARFLGSTPEEIKHLI